MKKKSFIFGLVGVVIGVIFDELVIGNGLRRLLQKKEDNEVKFKGFYLVLIRWLRVHQEGRALEYYFKNNKVNSIAIYGMKELGEALLDELKDSEIDVRYGIDRDADNIYVALDVYTPDEELEEVDMIVVTAIHYFDEIERCLRSSTNARIVSLEDVLWEV